MWRPLAFSLFANRSIGQNVLARLGRPDISVVNIGWMFEDSQGEDGMVFRAGARPLIALDPLRRGEGITLERIIPYSAVHLLQCNIHHSEAAAIARGRSSMPART